MTVLLGRQLQLLAMLLACGVACAPRGGAGPQSAGYDRYLITPEELATVEVRTTALEVIQRMRPNWLQSRGPAGISGSSSPLVYYVNQQRIGENPLARYAAGELLEIRFLNAVEATQRFGTGHTSGAILLTTR